jgi:hypothetical protein
MDPSALYLILFVGAIAVCLSAAIAWRPPTRACPSCGGDTPIQARRCRRCGYRAIQA